MWCRSWAGLHQPRPVLREVNWVRPLEVPGSTAVDSVWLPHLFDQDAKQDDFPKGIPLTLSEASVKVTLGKWKKLVITSKLQCSAPSTDHDMMPRIWLDELQLLYMKVLTAGRFHRL